MERACAEVGRDPATLRRTWFGWAVCAPTTAEARAIAGGRDGLIGTPAEVIEQLEAFVALGFDYFILASSQFSDPTSVELFKGEQNEEAQMSSPRPFRFGHFANASSRAEWLEKARQAEAAGFSTLQVGDHLGGELGPFPALAAAAGVTTTLRLGTHVLGNDFYNPVMLARDAASVDILSDGRLELGVGTGWLATDYTQSGIALEAPGVRVSRLEEGLRVLKGALGEPPFSFEGRFYTVRELAGLPRPVQRPRPPLLVGGGARRTLSLAAREAEIVGINARTTAEGDLDIGSMTADAAAQKVAWVREAAGEQFAELELNILLVLVRITDDPRGAVEETLRDFGVPPEVLSVEAALESPSILVGSLDYVTDLLLERRERYGISYISSWEPVATMAPIIARLAGR